MAKLPLGHTSMQGVWCTCNLYGDRNPDLNHLNCHRCLHSCKNLLFWLEKEYGEKRIKFRNKLNCSLLEWFFLEHLKL